jgi:hypothetical protein
LRKLPRGDATQQAPGRAHFRMGEAIRESHHFSEEIDMKTLKLAALTFAAAGLIAAAPSFADERMDAEKFVKMCDANKDGMVSKEEFMKHAEKVWAKMDAKKAEKMDTKQFEAFLKELMKSGA